MPLKSKLLKSISGSEGNPQSWEDLTSHEKFTAWEVLSTSAAADLSLVAGFAIAAYEIKSTPEGCTAVIFPEQTFIDQPEHCHKARRGRSPAGLGL